MGWIILNDEITSSQCSEPLRCALGNLSTRVPRRWGGGQCHGGPVVDLEQNAPVIARDVTKGCRAHNPKVGSSNRPPRHQIPNRKEACPGLFFIVWD